MKKFKLKLALLLIFLSVVSCRQDDETTEDHNEKLSQEKLYKKNEFTYERKKRDSIGIRKYEQATENSITEAVDPDKIKPPQH